MRGGALESGLGIKVPETATRPALKVTYGPGNSGGGAGLGRCVFARVCLFVCVRASEPGSEL